ncbi:MAG: 16S rRNA (cytosine(1402)-N(4))-methyltransferase RsmH [Candidatus Nomurabacteria bacterium]|nr:16S rRNA (cytosine(1402)-N(4))-methyltransferase RsmH [Candidatus Nomurabacteria bacterium]USN87965.1 MAG: 16S rRNA (cytosine(1402)-N(4))-methyltransferase RsmH [Candidatus Nomurabacteria bacterium]
MKKHITVLQAEAVRALNLKPDSVVVDATYGGGGHALSICRSLDENGVYIGIDADKAAFLNKRKELEETKPVIHLVNDNFSNLEQILGSLHIKKVDAILADLGWRTDQFEGGGKGFSFQADEPLLMTYGQPEDNIFTAYDLVNTWAEEDLANVLYGYGDERFARRIAKAIVTAREKTPISTARQLAEIITQAVPKQSAYKKSINPATKSFQAIRIAVNDELKVLEKFVDQAAFFLEQEGRLAIISFHSIEDRIVKLKFRELAETEEFELVVKKPITANEEELSKNPRARSAKLRIIRKIFLTDKTQHEYKGNHQE